MKKHPCILIVTVPLASKERQLFRVDVKSRIYQVAFILHTSLHHHIADEITVKLPILHIKTAKRAKMKNCQLGMRKKKKLTRQAIGVI